jgi:transposase
LIGERTQWMQRIQATLYHHGVNGAPEKLRTGEGRAFLGALRLPIDARERIEVALTMIDAIEDQIAPLERDLRQLARRQAGCRALMGLYGMGELTSLVTLCDYHALKARGLSHTRASLTIARKLARRSYHVLRELGPSALDPVATA